MTGLRHGMFGLGTIALSLLVVASSYATGVTDLPIWDAPAAKAKGAIEFHEIKDVRYFDGAGSDKFRNSLDLYLPKNVKDFPVLVYFHGGAWVVGDNRCCGLYPSVARYLASRGIGMAMPNYRLSPAVKHPEHIKDVARAVAWTKANIANHGGDPAKMILMGHSAGGHLVTLLATDDQYLKAEKLTSADLRGVIGVSGVYNITPGSYPVTLGGAGPGGFRFNVMGPLRGDNWRTSFAALPGVPLKVNIFSLPFGDDPKVRQEASPITHVQANQPPILLFNADSDLPHLSEMAAEFHEAVLKAGSKCEHVVVKNRNHNSIMFRAIEPGDPVADKVVEFIRDRTKPN